MEIKGPGLRQFGYGVSLFTAGMTLLTFGIALCTPPLSGPFCRSGCFEYPYHEIAGRFPRDYYWMIPAFFLSISYMAMMISVHKVVPPERSVFSLTSAAFAVMCTLLLSVDYFVQVSFIQPSLLAGETDGVALLSQYNPHGLFILLEELGFIFMNLSFFSLVPAINGSSPTERGLRRTFISGFLLMVVSFAVVLTFYGINREYRFEVMIITVTWIELLIASLLFSKYFKNIHFTESYDLVDPA